MRNERGDHMKIESQEDIKNIVNSLHLAVDYYKEHYEECTKGANEAKSEADKADWMKNVEYWNLKLKETQRTFDNVKKNLYGGEKDE